MFYLIYETTNLINGKIYIGAHKTDNIHDNYLGSGKLLKNAIKKYGIDNFQKKILFSFDREKDMYEKEKEIIDEKFVKDPQTYNLKVGGFGGWDHVPSSKNIPKSEETKMKMKLAKSGNKWKAENNPFFNKKHKLESIELISKASKKRGKAMYEASMAAGTHPNANAQCPHCNKIGQRRAMLRWHFDNCKLC